MRQPNNMYGGVYIPQLTPVNKVLLIVCGSLFLIQTILKFASGVPIDYFMGLSSAMVLKGHIYQFFTFPFFQTDFTGLLFNGFLIWFIGSDLERQFGSKFYSFFLIVSTLGAGFLYFLGSLLLPFPSLAVSPLLGISGTCFALLMAYGLIFSERILTFMLIFPVRAKYFCLILIGIELFMGIFSPYGQASWGHLTAMALGFLVLRLKAFWIARGKSGPFSGGGFGKFGFSFKKSKKEKFILIKNEDPDPKKDPKYWQ